MPEQAEHQEPEQQESTQPEQLSELRDERLDPPIVSSDIVYEGKVWNVRKDVFDYDGSEITREYIDHTGAVAVMAMDEEGRVLLIQQYRHPIRHRDWELPAGLLDMAGEDPVDAAKRELAEEVDLVADEWHLLLDFMTSVGGNNEAVRIYLARGVHDAPEAFEREEEERDIEKRWVDLDDVVAGVLDRRLQNSILAVAALAAQVGRERNWSTLNAPDEPWTRHPRYTRP
jgi:ADP-ribose pyrophosphatase